MSSEILLDFQNSRNYKIIFRLYRNEDSLDMMNLENHARQSKQLGGLLTSGKIFTMPFDSKAKKYENSVILVAEHQINETKSIICGGVVLGIKNIFYQNQKVRAGYIFDLRVHEDYQRIGLGSQFSSFLEKIAISRGVNMLYLSVNRNNQKAINLYQKMKFITISERILHGHEVPMRLAPLEMTRVVNLDLNYEIKMNFRKCEKPEAKALLEKYYFEQDLALQNMDELLNLSCFEGFYIVETDDKANCAGICLYKIEVDNVMGLTKLFVEPLVYFKSWYQSLVISLLTLVAIYIHQTIKEMLNDQSYSWIIASIIVLSLMWFSVYIYFTITKFMGSFCGLTLKGRCFAPVYFGANEIKKTLIDYLIQQVKRVAFSKNISVLIFNFDPRDSLKEFYPSIPKLMSGRISRPTIFMAKPLDSTIKIEEQYACNAKDIMFDPRDF